MEFLNELRKDLSNSKSAARKKLIVFDPEMADWVVDHGHYDRKSGPTAISGVISLYSTKLTRHNPRKQDGSSNRYRERSRVSVVGVKKNGVRWF